MCDHDRALALGEEREEATGLEPIQHQIDASCRGRREREADGSRPTEGPSRLPKRDAVQPALEVPVVRRRSPQALVERLLEPIERGVAVHKDRDEGAVDARRRCAIQRPPAITVDGHLRRVMHLRGRLL